MNSQIYVVVHFSGDALTTTDQTRLVPHINDFYDHYAELLGSGYFNVNVRNHGQNVQCSLHVVAETKSFLVRGHNTTARLAFGKALHTLTSQVKTLRDAAVKEDILRYIHEPLPEKYTVGI